MRREIDPDDGSCLCDVDMRRRVIERVDPYLESFFTNYRRHITPNALRSINFVRVLVQVHLAAQASATRFIMSRCPGRS
jgi:hypothetical protein